MKTTCQVSAPDGRIKACADAPEEVAGMKRKAPGVNHHPAKHSSVTKMEENPQLPKVTNTEENPVLPSVTGGLIKKTFVFHGPGTRLDNFVLDANNAYEDFISYKLMNRALWSSNPDGEEFY